MSFDGHTLHTMNIHNPYGSTNCIRFEGIISAFWLTNRHPFVSLSIFDVATNVALNKFSAKIEKKVEKISHSDWIILINFAKNAIKMSEHGYFTKRT